MDNLLYYDVSIFMLISGGVICPAGILSAYADFWPIMHRWELLLKKCLSICLSSLGSFCANFHQHRLELIRWSIIIYDAIRSLWTTFSGRFKVASQLNCNNYTMKANRHIHFEWKTICTCVCSEVWLVLLVVSSCFSPLLLYTAYLGFKLLIFDRHNVECDHRNII